MQHEARLDPRLHLFFTIEHGIDPFVQAAFLRKFQEQPDRFGGYQIFPVIEINACGLDAEAVAPLRIVREEVPELEFSIVLEMKLQRFPGGTFGK